MIAEFLQFAFWGDFICSFQPVLLLQPRVQATMVNRITCSIVCPSELQRVQDSWLKAKTPHWVPGPLNPSRSTTGAGSIFCVSRTLSAIAAEIPVNRLFWLHYFCNIWRWPQTWGHMPKAGTASQHSLSWIPRNSVTTSAPSDDVLNTRTAP